MFSRLFDSFGVFERAFQPVEGGYLYYPWRWSAGYLVTEEEFSRLRDDFRSLLSFASMTKLIGVVVAASFLASLLSHYIGQDLTKHWLFSLGLPATIVLWIVWRTSAAQRLVWAREPIAPRRSAKETDIATVTIISWPLLIFVILLGIWFTFLAAMMAMTNQIIGIPLLLLFGAATFMNLRVAVRKWSRTRSSEGEN